jgi:hypothetical protein
VDNTPATRGARGRFDRSLTTAERDAEAARLRARGLSYRQIATELDVDVANAHRAVKRALAEIVAEPAADVVAFELERLDGELVRLDALYARVEEVLAREHVTVSQGHVVEHDGIAVPDDDWILRAVDRLVRIDESRRRNGESRRKLLGLDSPVKTQISGGLTYEVVGVDTAALR